MSIYSLDTSVVIRVLTNDLPEKRRLALDFISKDDNIFRLSDLALSEIVYVLSSDLYKHPREAVVDKINFFLTRFCDNIIYNRDLTSHVFPFYLEHPKLSFNDCCLAYYAEASDAEPLYTFDTKLARQHPSAKLLA